jgi:hypothetical protein
MEQPGDPAKLYSGDNFLADILCRLSRKSGAMEAEVTVPAGGRSLKPDEELVIHLSDGRKAFCQASRALASGAWIVHISRIEE